MFLFCTSLRRIAVPARAEVGRRGVQGAREKDQGQAEAARRVHRGREPAARRNARAAGREVHGAPRGRCTGEPKEDVARVADDGEARLRAVRPLDQVPGQAAEVLSLPDQVAGDGQGGRNGRRGEDARRRVPGAPARRDVRAERGQGGERHHPREGAAGDEEEGAGEPAERVRDQRRFLPGLRPRAEEPRARPHASLDRRVSE